jgi:integrase/recombinase XerD
VSEALSTRCEAVIPMPAGCWLRVRRKGGRLDDVALADTAADALLKYTGNRTEGPVFLARTGRGLGYSGAYRLLKRLAAQALPAPVTARFTPHLLRASAITLSLEAGAAYDTVVEQAGHTSARSTMIYARSAGRFDRQPTHVLAALLSSSTDPGQNGISRS